MNDLNHSHDHDDHHNHSHDHGQHKKFGCSETVRLSIMLTMITLFFFLEITAGRITNSITLVTDSFHMLSDVIALFVALFSSRVIKFIT
jgi:Co/Zn/Cd efflux system component